MAIDTLTVDGTEHVELNAEDVTKLLKVASNILDRVMKLRDPSSTGFEVLPNEMTLEIPAGGLGCSVVGSPPHINAFREDSPVAHKVPPHMFIDGFVLSNGHTRFSIDSDDLVDLLGSSIDQEGRKSLLKNGRTQKPSEEKEIFPENLQVELPSGKLGISFRGRIRTRVSNVHHDSPLTGKVCVGVFVDEISMPGGSAFTELTARKTSRVLKDAKKVKGRIVTFVRPGARRTNSIRSDECSKSKRT